MIDFSNVKRLHFIGIGGISMSSLARFLHEKGYCVSGTDENYTENMTLLQELGINVWSGFEPALIGTPDLVVYSSAIKKDNVELSYCLSNSYVCVERYVLLSYICNLFPYVIGIAGTHGKTTVTSMCADVFYQANLAFYAHIGGDSVNHGNYRYTGDKYFICEACEYRKSLLSLSTQVGVILNVEFDHPDTYKTVPELYDTFDTFFEICSKKGLKIINSDCTYYQLRQSKNDVITYGYSERADYRITETFSLDNGCLGCKISHFGIPLCEIRLNVVGRHNLINALACVCICHSIGISVEHIKIGLNKFNGVKRRFAYCGIYNGCYVYNDYAHHPSEINVAIDVARSLNKGKLLVVFQPHTYSRTLALKNGFIQALSACDKLVVIKEYPAREKPCDGIDAHTLFKNCINENKYYCKTLMDSIPIINKITAPEDIILILGAGDVINLCSMLTTT